MPLKSLCVLSIIFGSMLHSAQSISQTSPYIDMWETEINTTPPPPIFNLDTKLLTIPRLQTYSPQDNSFTSYSGIQLRENGNGLFELEQFFRQSDELLCTEDKIVNAAGKLNLNLTLDEAEALIGCSGRSRVMETDPTLGRLVRVSWPASTDDPFQLSLNTASDNIIRLPAYVASSSLSLNFREGELVSYFANSRTRPGHCEEDVLDKAFTNLQLGMTYEQVTAITNCDGNVTFLTMNIEGETQYVTWIEKLQAYAGNDFLTAGEADNEMITVGFLNGVANKLRLYNRHLNQLAPTCTLADLENAEQILATGDSESFLLTTLPCPASVFTTELLNDSSSRSIYHWSVWMGTPPSLLNSNVKNLTVSVVDGRIESFQLGLI